MALSDSSESANSAKVPVINNLRQNTKRKTSSAGIAILSNSPSEALGIPGPLKKTWPYVCLVKGHMQRIKHIIAHPAGHVGFPECRKRDRKKENAGVACCVVGSMT